MKLSNLIKLFLILILIFLFNCILINQKCSQNKKSTYKNYTKIYFITPTYPRPVQEAELTRLSHTLLLVPNLHWIIIEDSDHRTSLVKNFLQNLLRIKIYDNFKFTHLNIPTPKSFKTKSRDPNWLKPRGVWQRNEALRWLRENVTNMNERSVIYFGDDDNTYDLRLFDEMRDTKKVSVFPVGLVGGLLVEKPLVNDQGKVSGFNSIWKPQRKFPIDMSGFAINTRLILEKMDAYFSPNVPRGYQETHLLSQLIQSIEELEPKADLCTKIFVWHTRTEMPKLRQKSRN